MINKIPPNFRLSSKRISRRTIILSIIAGFLIIICVSTRFESIFGYTCDFFLELKSKCELYHSENERTMNENCHWYFLNYTSSSWENIWYENIDVYKENVCETLSNTNNLQKTILMMQRLIELNKFEWKNKNKRQNKNDELFSKMYYRQRCFDFHTKTFVDIAESSQLIEPLIGLLRDPFTICSRLSSSFVPSSLYDDAILLSKRFLLPSISAPYYISSLIEKYKPNISNMLLKSNNFNENISPWMYSRSKIDYSIELLKQDYKKIILFDLGSSYFGSSNISISDTSTRWFYEYYKRFHIKFDRIIAYEIISLDSKFAWEQLPDDVFPIYTLINSGCTKDGKFNPWNTLKYIAKSYDHVIIKLDIDTPYLENILINQIINDPNIYSLIDELFFEHHVSIKEMMPYWGSNHGTLKDSYVLFTKLRQLGIRMHSWP